MPGQRARDIADIMDAVRRASVPISRSASSDLLTPSSSPARQLRGLSRRLSFNSLGSPSPDKVKTKPSRPVSSRSLAVTDILIMPVQRIAVRLAAARRRRVVRCPFQ